MDIQSLKKLALLGAHNKPVGLTSIEFASYIDGSPQTAARKLKSLAEEKLISRKVLPEGQLVSITEYGISLLRKELNDYQEIFSSNGNVKILIGRVVTGLGEGQYYISLDGYRQQFLKNLGFDPYPGTLNIRLDDRSIDIRKKINPKIKITGFTDQNRTFGSGSCFNIKIKDVIGAVITPERTHYPEDIIEVIAPVNLREYLNIKDGSTIEVELIK